MDARSGENVAIVDRGARENEPIARDVRPQLGEPVVHRRGQIRELLDGRVEEFGFPEGLLALHGRCSRPARRGRPEDCDRGLARNGAVDPGRRREAAAGYLERRRLHVA